MGTNDVTIDDGQGQATIENDDYLGGRVFNDLDNDGSYEPADGDAGIAGVTVELVNQMSGTVMETAITAPDGTFSFDVTIPSGTYKIAQIVDELMDLGLLDGNETAGVNGGNVDNSQDSDEISDILVGDDRQAAEAVDYLFAEIEPSDLFGAVWRDFNNDGEINFNEPGIEGAEIELTGTDDRGNAVNVPPQTTDGNGAYAFVKLRPGTYRVHETQPAGYDDGREGQHFSVSNPHAVNAPAIDSGANSANDEFTGITLAPGSTGDYYNFGERPVADGPIDAGTTATIGFWHNKNGQALIEGLNGNSQSTFLGSWLAATFPEMYGTGARYVGANGDAISMDLSEATNEKVAEVFRFLHKRNKKSAVENGGAPKVDAQVMAVALAMYATSEDLIGADYIGSGGVSENINHVQSFGFTTSRDGIAYETFQVSSVVTEQEATDLGITLDDDGNATIIDILLSTDQLASSGLLYDADDSTQIDTSFERFLRMLANELYTAINEGSDR